MAIVAFAEHVRTPKRTVAPTVLLLTVDDAKLHMRVEHDEDDDLIEAYIVAATEKLESDTRRGYLTQTWVQRQDDFCEDVILLRRCPVIAISSVTYVDTDGNTDTISSSDYQLDAVSEPARLMPAYDESSWPTDVRYDTLNAVTITYTVGYGAAASASPKAAVQAVRLLTSHYFHQRCPVAETSYAEVPLGYSALVDLLRWE